MFYQLFALLINSFIHILVDFTAAGNVILAAALVIGVGFTVLLLDNFENFLGLLNTAVFFDSFEESDPCILQGLFV